MAADVKNIDIKNRTYYFFNDMINLKNFDLNLLKIDNTLDTSRLKKLIIMKIFIV